MLLLRLSPSFWVSILIANWLLKWVTKLFVLLLPFILVKFSSSLLYFNLEVNILVMALFESYNSGNVFTSIFDFRLLKASYDLLMTFFSFF
jgi:hypothetical protein